jgi:hypothetical protein
MATKTLFFLHIISPKLVIRELPFSEVEIRTPDDACACTYALQNMENNSITMVQRRHLILLLAPRPTLELHQSHGIRPWSR